MNSDRIKEIQQSTGLPESVSVQQALLKVWNECAQESAERERLVLEKERERIVKVFDTEIQLRKTEPSRGGGIEIIIAACANTLEQLKHQLFPTPQKEERGE